VELRDAVRDVVVDVGLSKITQSCGQIYRVGQIK